MSDLALNLSFDTFCRVAANRDILGPVDIIALMLSCRRFRKWITKHIAESASSDYASPSVSRGYPERLSFISAFTCYCGKIGWDVRHHCDCFVKCRCCYRKLPDRLTVRIGCNIYCGFPCEECCDRCNEWITRWNINEFIFIEGLLRCKRHGLTPDIRFTYEWKGIEGTNTRSLFADELLGADSGPIRFEVIAKYDPNHRLLTQSRQESDDTSSQSDSC